MAHLRARIVASAIAVGIGIGLAPVGPTAPAGAVVVAAPTVDPTDRASVLASYQSSLVEARAVPVGWTGSAASCTAGTETAASVEATRAAINFYRALNGLPAITMSASKNSQARAAALLMHANGRISHSPTSGWACYSAAGRTAAETSNLSQGLTGAGAIDVYMADPGAMNAVAGHRRWLLYPRATTFGTGSTSTFNALRIFGDESAGRPSGVSWVSWPNAGFVPKRALRPFSGVGPTTLFSLSSNQHPDADYSSATVTVKVGATNLPVTVHPPADQHGDATLTWDVTMPAGYDSSDADVRFDIRVAGVRAAGRALPTYAYSSTAVVTAAAPDAPTAVSAAPGRAQATVAWTAPASDGGSPVTGYRVTPYIGTAAQAPQTVAGTGTRGTVTGLRNDTAYTFRVQAVNAEGVGAASATSAAVMPRAVPASWVPYRSWTDLVDQVHDQMLGRPPTAAERTRWVGALHAGTATPGDLLAELRLSTSHRTVVDPIVRLYRSYYLRMPDRGGLDYWIAQRRAGRSLVSVSAFFARSSEFASRYGTTTDREFAALVYQNILGRPGEASGITYWSDELDRGRRNRGSVMIGFSESAEYRTAHATELDVVVLHLLGLDQAPTATELDAGMATLEGGTSVAVYARSLLAPVA